MTEAHHADKTYRGGDTVNEDVSKDDATPDAVERANALGIDIEDVDASGDKVTVEDVTQAAFERAEAQQNPERD